MFKVCTKGKKSAGNTIGFARALSIVHRRDELRGVAVGYVYFFVPGVLWKAHGPDLLVLKRTRTGEECQGPLRRFDEGHCPICKRRFKLLGLYSALDESRP